MANNVPPPPEPPAIIRTAQEMGLGQGVAEDLYQQGAEGQRVSDELRNATIRNNQPTTGQGY